MVTGLVAIAILAGGCGSAGGDGGASPGPPNASTTSAAAALTLAQARAILTNYEKVNNQANSHLSDKLISSIETGPMLKGDLIDYKITRAGDVAKIKEGGSWLGGTNWKPRTDPVYALKTTDGGALVWYTATQSLDYHTVSPTAWYQPIKTLRALGQDSYHSTFHGTWLWRFAAHVPQGAGRISVVGAGSLPIGASGS